VQISLDVAGIYAPRDTHAHEIAVAIGKFLGRTLAQQTAAE
jgi:hypothetical protein